MQNGFVTANYMHRVWHRRVKRCQAMVSTEHGAVVTGCRSGSQDHTCTLLGPRPHWAHDPGQLTPLSSWSIPISVLPFYVLFTVRQSLILIWSVAIFSEYVRRFGPARDGGSFCAIRMGLSVDVIMPEWLLRYSTINKNLSFSCLISFFVICA